jgi:two-component system OmpR family sensor kinase
VRRQLSLRLRLLFAVGAVTLLALVVADVAVYASIGSYLNSETDAVLDISHRAVEQAADGANGAERSPLPPGGPGPTSDDDDAPPPSTSSFCQIGRESAPGMFIEVLTAADTAVSAAEVCSAYQPGGADYTPRLPAHITGFATTSSSPNEPTTYLTVPSAQASGPEFRVRASVLTSGEVLIVADPIDATTATLRRLLWAEIAVTAAALLGAIALGLWLVRVGLRPLRDVERTAEAIAAGDLMHRVPNANETTEVGHVATALNVMLERIETSFAALQTSETRLRRFVSDASHELRTPVAAISAYAQLFAHGAAAHQDDLERSMQGIERESARMGRLVDDLLILARFDEHRVVASEPVELVGLAAEAVETATAVGPQWPTRLVARQPVEVDGDRQALRRVLDNLLANVRAHTPIGTVATVTVASAGDQAVLTVADDGPGLGDGDAAALFERFVRSDPSRARATGGAGLGLAIVAAIVAAHGGSVVAGGRDGGGAVFTVLLPRRAATAPGEI